MVVIDSDKQNVVICRSRDPRVEVGKLIQHRVNDGWILVAIVAPPLKYGDSLSVGSVSLVLDHQATVWVCGNWLQARTDGRRLPAINNATKVPPRPL